MAKKVITETKVTKRITWDNMRMDAKLPSGASMYFSIGRSRDTLQLAFSNDDATLKEQHRKMSEWLKLRKGEDNNGRFERLEKVLKASKSGAEVIAKLPLY